MKTSQTGIDLIKRFEGLELQAYKDIAGIWTIGYGYTGGYPKSFFLPGVVSSEDVITEEQAEELLREALKPREDAVRDLVSVPLNQNQFDALVSFIYNIGVGAFERSTARKRLNKGDYEGAADALTWFKKATVDGVLRPVEGLTRRREAEAALFNTPILIDEPSNNPNVIGYRENEDSRVCPVSEVSFLDVIFNFVFRKERNL